MEKPTTPLRHDDRPRFQEHPACRKCGNDEAAAEHCPGCADHPKADAIHRTCTRCGFGWLEGCLDA